MQVFQSQFENMHILGYNLKQMSDASTSNASDIMSDILLFFFLKIYKINICLNAIPYSVS